jgi:Domain of unknown function (DUF4330)/IPT/TIG domain
MTVIDERGRVFGRINLIDAAAALLLFVLIPVAYGAYVLFRTPPAKLTSITPPTVSHGPNQRLEIHGVNLRPYMRVTFGGIQGVTFAINSTTSAQVEVPELPPGVYDVALYDYKQEVDHLSRALTVLSVAQVPSVDVEVSGSFKGLNETSAREFRPGVKLTKGDISAEVLRVGATEPSLFRMVAGPSILAMPVTGQLELPAALRVRCFTEVASDGAVRCMVPGPQHPAPIAPDSMLTLPASAGWISFQISTVALTAAPTLVTLRVTFSAAPEVATMIKAGDLDVDAVAYASTVRAKVVGINAVRGGTAVDATLTVPATLGPTGWFYNNQPLKAGLPFRFETAGYVVNGQVIGVNPPAAAAAR